ncbi:MAG TPA: hypothetical protein VFP58_00895 [Candidatus Eisenbacteria bacterium]|nr:hypothetical protein [Candidatus Eisenbacteria bacterium]
MKERAKFYHVSMGSYVLLAMRNFESLGVPLRLLPPPPVIPWEPKRDKRSMP